LDTWEEVDLYPMGVACIGEGLAIGHGALLRFILVNKVDYSIRNSDFAFRIYRRFWLLETLKNANRDVRARTANLGRLLDD
jgi:hypothetical protein